MCAGLAVPPCVLPMLGVGLAASGGRFSLIVGYSRWAAGKAGKTQHTRMYVHVCMGCAWRSADGRPVPPARSTHRHLPESAALQGAGKKGGVHKGRGTPFACHRLPRKPPALRRGVLHSVLVLSARLSAPSCPSAAAAARQIGARHQVGETIAPQPLPCMPTPNMNCPGAPH